MNRTRASSLEAFGLRDQRNRIYPALEASDGSTLSLDFTQMSLLDSRFTFSRSSNATLINSSGYVQYANHNLVRNSTFSSLTGWAPTGTGTTTNAGGVLTLSTSAAQTQLYYSQTNANGFQDNAPVSGRVYSASINVTAISGGISYQELITIGGSIGSVTRYKDGVLVSDGDTASTGLITIVWTSGGSNTLRIGISASGSTSYPSASVSMTLPRCVIGSQTQPTYIESPVASTYQAPRFDYSPTTLAPRGLLIEGSVTNLSRSSADLTNATYWTLQTAYTATSNSAGPSPDGTNNASSFTEPSTSLQRSIYQSYTGSAAGTYTGSMWAKLSSGSTRYIRLVVSSSPGNFGYVTVNISTGSVQQPAAVVGTATNASATVTAYPAGWYRITLTVTLAASIDFMFAVPMDVTSIDTPTTNYGRVSYLGNGSVFLLWGAQLEAGSGASSYIPTGTSSVQRTVDICTMSNIAAINYNANGGTLFAHFSNNTENGNFAGSIAFNNGGNYAQRFRWGSGVLLASYFQTNGTSALGSNLNGSRTSLGSAKAATSYSFDGTTTSTAMSINGAQATTTPTSSAASGVSIATALALNSDNSSAGSGYPSIAIRSIKFWPTGLTMAQMNALTVNP